MNVSVLSGKRGCYRHLMRGNMILRHTASTVARCLPALGLVLMVLAALAGAAKASTQAGESPLLLNDTTRAFAGAAKASYLEDASGRLRIEDVADPALRARLRAVDTGGGQINFGFSRSTYWLALPVQFAADGPSLWLLEVGFPSLDHVDVFTPRTKGGFYKQTSGDLLPFASRPYAHRNLVFPISLDPGVTQTVYLRVASSGSLTIPLTLWQPAALHERDLKSYGLLGLYYGALLALLIYNLLLYVTLRDRVFLTCTYFVAAMAIGMVSLDGMGSEFLWPDSPAWGNIVFILAMAATGLFGAQFVRMFLRTRHNHPSLDRLFVTLAAIFAIAAAAPVLLDYRFAVILTCVNGLLFLVSAICAGIYCELTLPADRQKAGARYFLAVWSVLLIGSALFALRSLGWIATTDFTSQTLQTGSAVAMLLLCAAMTGRIQTSRRSALESERMAAEKQHLAEQQMEARIAARMHELEQANIKLRTNEAELEYMARHDPLTGLPNRSLLDDRLDQALARAKRSGRSIAIMLADLDRFKAINDNYGHPVGDQMLRAISDRLTDCLRNVDTLARIGGDEFVIILEEIQDHSDATLVAEKLIGAACLPVELPQGHLQVGMCIGIAYFPLHASDAKSLIRHADDAMYAAKAAGGNCWRSA